MQGLFFAWRSEMTNRKTSKWFCVLSLMMTFALVAAVQNGKSEGTFEFINTSFQNASPLFWEVDAEGSIIVNLIYDHERGSINRANGHWYFQLQAQAGSDQTIILKNFDNIWNGMKGSPVSERTSCYLSNDGVTWKAVAAEKTKDNRIRIKVHMDKSELYIARMEPYGLSDLNEFLEEIRPDPLVEITIIGKTVEGRELEMVRIGKPDAPFSVLIRARAHAWEAGGNWVVGGLIKSLLEGDKDNNRYLKRYCLYVMPMANKDGVVRGMTRFNVMGMDLNRNWDKPADSRLAPENHALEVWLKGMIEKGMKPDLAIDLHNDNGGNLHISRPDIDLSRYLANMERVESLLRKHTWFTEGSTGKDFRNPGSIGCGLLERFGIDSFVYELNCDWIAGLDKVPYGRDWELLGRQLREVFYRYFEKRSSLK